MKMKLEIESNAENHCDALKELADAVKGMRTVMLAESGLHLQGQHCHQNGATVTEIQYDLNALEPTGDKQRFTVVGEYFDNGNSYIGHILAENADEATMEAQKEAYNWIRKNEDVLEELEPLEELDELPLNLRIWAVFSGHFMPCPLTHGNEEQ